MASSGGDWGMFFKQELERRVIISTSKFFRGFSFETLHFFEKHRPPPPPPPFHDVINDRSLNQLHLTETQEHRSWGNDNCTLGP